MLKPNVPPSAIAVEISLRPVSGASSSWVSPAVSV